MKVCATFAYEASRKAPSLLRGTFESCIKRASALGFDCIEPQLNLDPENLPDWKAVKEQCDKLGIYIAAYATGSLYTKNGLSFIDPDDTVVQKLIDRLQLYLDGAMVTGGKLIIGCVRGNIAGADYAACEERFAQGMKELLRRAADSGVTVLLEAINRYENDYLATAAQTAAFIKKYGLMGLEILLDTFHMNIEEKSLEAAFNDAAGYLGHIHAADNTRRVPGSGALPWVNIIGALKRIGYHGVLSFEAIVDSEDDSEAVRGLDFIKGITGLPVKPDV